MQQLLKSHTPDLPCHFLLGLRWHLTQQSMSDESLNALQCFSTRSLDQLDKESVGPEGKMIIIIITIITNSNNNDDDDDLVIKKTLSMSSSSTFASFSSSPLIVINNCCYCCEQ